MIKLLALDMDGTLLNDRHEISDGNMKALRAAKEKGVIIIFCSGREVASLKFYASQVPTEAYICALNGAVLIGADGKVLLNHTICFDTLEALYEDAKRMGAYPIAFSGNTVFVEKSDDPRARFIEPYTHSAIYRTEDFSRDMRSLGKENSVNKLLMLDDPERMRSYEKILREKFNDRLNMAYSLPGALEAFPKESGKGRALEELAKILGIDRSEIMAIGDGENDISMIEFAGLGVALENAQESLKARADEIGAHCLDDGVAREIYKHILGDGGHYDI